MTAPLNARSRERAERDDMLRRLDTLETSNAQLTQSNAQLTQQVAQLTVIVGRLTPIPIPTPPGQIG